MIPWFDIIHWLGFGCLLTSFFFTYKTYRNLSEANEVIIEKMIHLDKMQNRYELLISLLKLKYPDEFKSEKDADF